MHPRLRALLSRLALAPSLALLIVLRVLFSFGGVDFMATTTRSREIDPELMTSRMFAQVFQAYVECTEEIQSLIRDMVEIVNDSSATEDEKLMACSTIAESLFPSRHHGQLGVDLEQAERLDAERSARDQRRSRFDGPPRRALRGSGPCADARARHDASPTGHACEIGQPAVSNLLSRRSRPQRRTVEKIARALGVATSEIWPEGDTPS